MTQWYYVDNEQQRHGPIDASAVADLFRAGTLSRASLVWREGMQEWTALINVAPELRLDMTPPAPAPETIEIAPTVEVQEDRPLTGRAVFTASEPTYAASAPVARSEPTIATGDSPYAAPRRRGYRCRPAARRRANPLLRSSAPTARPARTPRRWARWR